jgi:hypothetical protein
MYLFFPLYGKGWWLFYVETLIQQIAVSTPGTTHKQIRQLIDPEALADHFGSFFMKI